MRWNRISKFLKVISEAIEVAFVGLGIMARMKKGDSFYSNEVERKNPFAGKRLFS